MGTEATVATHEEPDTPRKGAAEVLRESFDKLCRNSGVTLKEVKEWFFSQAFVDWERRFSKKEKGRKDREAANSDRLSASRLSFSFDALYAEAFAQASGDAKAQKEPEVPEDPEENSVIGAGPGAPHRSVEESLAISGRKRSQSAVREEGGAPVNDDTPHTRLRVDTDGKSEVEKGDGTDVSSFEHWINEWLATANTNETHDSATGQENEPLKLFIKKRALDFLYSADAMMRRPLHLAAYHNNLVLAKWMLDTADHLSLGKRAGAGGKDEEGKLKRRGLQSVESKDRMQPIHMAASAGHLSMVKLLVKRGAHVNASYGRPGNLKTPLDVARARGRDDVSKWLESKSAKSQIDLDGDLNKALKTLDSHKLKTLDSHKARESDCLSRTEL